MIGITNQRETTVLEPAYRQIVWQDCRTADYCRKLKEGGHEPDVTRKTGLLLDPYFSATKLNWILENVEGARAAADAGDLLFGTVDSYLIWRLTDRASHVTDATNAARTMMYNISEGCWDDDLLALFDIPKKMLPEVRDSSGEFGVTRPDLFGGMPEFLFSVWLAISRQPPLARLVLSLAWSNPPMELAVFALMNTGDKLVFSKNKLLTTIAYQIDGKPVYALEGSIFVAGAAVVQWLRDGLKMIRHASETKPLAESASDTEQVYLFPPLPGSGRPIGMPTAAVPYSASPVIPVLPKLRRRRLKAWLFKHEI